uniref:Sideroflexin 4 n=1 Tax=Spermophilus dauricus TaxID=99837 RepID=A0A8C9QS22_SPEDA
MNPEPDARDWQQSFVQRLLQWTELLDPTNLITSIEKIEKSRQLLFTSEDAYRFDVDDQRSCAAASSASSRHVRLCSIFFFKVFLSMMPAKGMKSMILPQVSLYAYTTGFTMVNGNASYSHSLPAKILLGAGVIASSTFFGVGIFTTCQIFFIPQNQKSFILIINLYSDLNDSGGVNRKVTVGLSPQNQDPEFLGMPSVSFAFTSAVRETAVSRAVLFGTSAFIPEVFTYFFKRTQFFLQNPQSLWALKLSCTLLVMGVMVPVSFSMFPQIGQVSPLSLISSQRENGILFHDHESNINYYFLI